MPQFAWLLLVAPLVAQRPDSSAYRHDLAPRIRAGQMSGPIKIDGRLDEPDWAAAEPATGFTQLNPHEGAAASERTEVRVLIDRDALYIGARMSDSDPRGIKSVLARRDESVESDLFEVLIDSYHDHLSAVRFQITPAGAIRDAILGASSQDGSDDVSWDPVWSSAARVDSAGWTAELAIPLSQLHYNPADEATWGIQFTRLIFRKGEDDYWAFTPKRETSGVNRYGHVLGLGRVRPQKLFELMPYASARAEYTAVPAGDPFRSGHDYFGGAGLDLKYGLTSNLTLNATVNPDFGQVEVDPAVVNLSAFETFFPEKRPFFVEGADVFRFGGIRSYNSFSFPRFFFSRRIGRQPQGSIGGADVAYLDVPNQTSIRAAAKLSGRTAGGWSVGLLDALTAEEVVRWQDTSGGRHTDAVEPLTDYFVGRFRKDLRAGNSTVGGIVTAVQRDLSDSSLTTLLRSRAVLAGLDFTNSWHNRAWSLDGAFTVSGVRGSSGAIAATQLASARYYARPDARTFQFDPGRTSLTGIAYQVSLARNAAVHWLGSLTYQETSPGFEVNDLGFQSQADRRALSTILIYKEDRPGKVVRNWNVIPFTNHAWNYDGNLIYGGLSVLGNLTFANYWSVNWRHDYALKSLDDRLTRGGPLAEQPRSRDVSFGFNSDSRRTTQFGGNLFYYWDRAGDWNGNGGVSVSLRPAPAARISIEPTLSRTHNLAQYVSTITDAAAAATFGARYVFATLDQTELSLVTRVDWTFSPRLSIQLYLQPLISAADFSSLKELQAPRTYDFVVYGRDRGAVTAVVAGDSIDPGDGGAPFVIANQDFNFRSLRANAVLRWEWRPGSTLFVVWQQGRQDVGGVGDFRFSRDFDALIHARADNIFAVKISYWLGL